MSRPVVVLVSSCLALFLGCEHKQYRVEMTARGKEFERTISYWDLSDPNKPKRLKFPAAELDRLKRVYGERGEVAGPTFTGRFKERTPDDVGGAGFYTLFDTRMGRVWIYCERFRGSDDPMGYFALVEEATDDLLRLFDGWIAHQMRDDSRTETLRRFVDKQLRRDLNNLAVYLWRLRDTDDSEETMSRVALYLAERGYFRIEDLPRFRRWIEGDMDREPEKEEFMRWLRRLVARRMGVPDGEPLPSSLDFLEDVDTAAKAFLEYYQTTDEYKKQVAEWEEHKRDDPDAQLDKTPRALTRWGELAVSFELFPRKRTVSLKLATDVEPISTNGQWDSAARKVVWTEAPLRDERSLPALCYSVWSKPTADFQKERFGKIVVAGEELADYVFWRKGLTDQEGEEWDRFLAGLTPSKEIEKKLRAFRFSHESLGERQEGKKSPRRHSDKAVQLLLAGPGEE